MSTRGIWGFYKNGLTKAVFNHYDSYPSGLGKDVLSLIVMAPNLEWLHELFDNIELIDDEEECGTPQDYLGYSGKVKMSDGMNYAGGADWWYIINLENNTLEVFKGFQTVSDKNRYQHILCCNKYFFNIYRVFDLKEIWEKRNIFHFPIN